jgi:hypothetical protein
MPSADDRDGDADQRDDRAGVVGESDLFGFRSRQRMNGVSLGSACSSKDPGSDEASTVLGWSGRTEPASGGKPNQRRHLRVGPALRLGPPGYARTGRGTPTAPNCLPPESIYWRCWRRWDTPHLRSRPATVGAGRNGVAVRLHVGSSTRSAQLPDPDRRRPATGRMTVTVLQRARARQRGFSGGRACRSR